MVVSFTGHRPDKITGWNAHPDRVERTLRTALAAEVERLAVEEGAHTFMSGMAPGVDLWAADEVLRLRQEGRIGGDVRLVLAIPYPNFERSFGVCYRALYESVAARADEVVYVSRGYHHGCFTLRNNFLADRADVVVAYYEGVDGGTRYTIRRAQKSGKRVVNVHLPSLF